VSSIVDSDLLYVSAIMLTDCCIASQRRDDERLTAGFKECRDATIRFLVDHHGEDSVGSLCTSLRMHLHQHLQSISLAGLTLDLTQLRN